ncbi:uncharacterized protein TNCV_2455951 [Trichonephila clavipes]|nr:uncharacterized protein TNCV_2455951 [Trichonephila clavipes]
MGPQFLREFAYDIRTAVNETMGETLAELFLGRKLITPVEKIVIVSDGTEFAVGDIERLFEEARRNTKVVLIAIVHDKNRVVLTEYKEDQMIRSMVGRKGGPEWKIRKGSDHRVPKRALSSNYTSNSNLPKFRKKRRREETVAPSTSGYNLRPRSGRGVEMKTQQGGPV